jgi:hypothetical protein
MTKPFVHNRYDRASPISILVLLATLLLSASAAQALTCAAPDESPRDQIANAYDQSDLVALVKLNSSIRYGELAVKAVWKGHPKPVISVQFAWADLPKQGHFVVFASKQDGAYVDQAICLMLWGLREELLRDIYGDPIELSSLNEKAND